MSQVQQIKEATSIVGVIGERINLTVAGARYRGLCPFHAEKSPSFFVNEELGVYKCFGCQAGGDVLTFLQEYDGMTFGEALEYLADRAGIKLQDFRQNDPQEKERELILAILAEAGEYFQLVLNHPVAGKTVSAYLKNRGLTKETIKIYHLGATSPSWDGLLRFLTQRKKRQPLDIVKTGLITQTKNGRFYDRFRNRLMFPLKNHRGQTVGFSGRVLDGASPDEAKYMNTPETIVYHKGKMFYGLYENMQAIKKEKTVIVVEGEFDMLSSVQAHVNNVVAVKGSAFTDDHAKLIKRYAQKVLLAMDTDKAGMAATARAAAVLEKEEVALRVIAIPAGKDPDDLARHEPKEWREATKQSISIYDFFLESLQKKYDLKKIEDKTAFIKEIAPIYGQISNVVEFDHYVQKLGWLLGVKEESVRQDLRRYRKTRGLRAGGSGGGEGATGAGARTAKEVAGTDKKNGAGEPKVAAGRRKNEQYLWWLLFNSEPEKINLKKQQLQAAEIKWQDPEIKEIAAAFFDFKLQFQLEKFNQFLGETQQKMLARICLSPLFVDILEKVDLEAEWQKKLQEMKNEEIRSKLDAISVALELLDGKEEKTEQEENRQQELLQEMVSWQKKMKY